MNQTYKLVLAEKPSVAGSIAAVIGAKERGDGCFIGSGYIISYCFGHLVELADPSAYGDQYKRWSLSTLPILPETWKFTAYADKEKQLNVIRSLMNRADVDGVVCATDAGREGQLIFKLVYDFCKCKKPVTRLWISSLEDSAIRAGFAALRDSAEYENLYRAALCRAQADWEIGLNATRLYSCLYNTTLNVGRVQSPTLAMIVEREKAVTAFVPTPFYTPVIDCGGTFTASGERFEDEESAETVRAAADGRDASVLSVEKARKTAAPPKLYDLTSLQRDANRLLGYTAQQTADYLQSLYERKLSTYPRVDSQYLTDDMSDTARAVIRAISGVYPFADALSFVPDVSRVINNSKVSDHHAIIPTIEIGKAELADLPAGERDLLVLIAARLYCAVAPIHSFETVTAVLECGDYNFTAKGKTVLDDSWKAIDTAFHGSLKNKPEKDDGDDGDYAALPELSQGQVFTCVTASVSKGKTKTPSRFTEGSLLHAMETASADEFPQDCERVGLGTPATRAGIIEKLIKTGFIERQKKQLVPTDKGVNLIAILPDNLKSPLLTAEWEQKLKLVEGGELAAADFIAGIEALTKSLVAANTAPIPEMVSVFAQAETRASGGAKGAAEGKPGAGRGKTVGKAVGKCPRCNSDVTEAATGFFCSSEACRFALFKDSRFWTAKGKTLTTTTAAALLSEGRVSFSDLKSEKTGKTYAATIILADDGAKTDFRLEFNKKRATRDA